MARISMEQYGANFVETGETLAEEASSELRVVVEDARDEMVTNLERARTGGFVPFKKLKPLTLKIREAQGITGKQPGRATGKMLRSLKDDRAVDRLGQFTFQIRPKSDKELEKMEFFINPGSQTVTKKQAGKLYGLTGKKVYVRPGSKIKKAPRNFKLSEARLVHHQGRGADAVGVLILDGIGATTDAPTFQGRSPKGRRK